MNFGGVKIDMSFKEAQELDAMIKRNKPKAIVVKEYNFTLSDGSKPTPSILCPNCGEIISLQKGDFCQFCGQRLDRENIAL